MFEALTKLAGKKPRSFQINTYILTAGFTIVGVAAAAATQLAVQTFSG